jgi:hypothetical protein
MTNRPLSDLQAIVSDVIEPHGSSRDPLGELTRAEAMLLLCLADFEETGVAHPELAPSVLLDMMLADLRAQGLTFFTSETESHEVFRRHRLKERGKEAVRSIQTHPAFFEVRRG